MRAQQGSSRANVHEVSKKDLDGEGLEEEGGVDVNDYEDSSERELDGNVRHKNEDEQRWR